MKVKKLTFPSKDKRAQYYQERLDQLKEEMSPNELRNARPVLKWAPVVEDAVPPDIDFLNNGGIDLFAAKNVGFAPVEAGEFYIATVPTTIIYEFPKGVHSMVVGRSGNAIKRGTEPFYGLIDSSYRGNITVKLYTHNTELVKTGIQEGMAVAQLVPINHVGMDLTNIRLHKVSMDELSETERGEKGFGSSGNNV